MNDMMDEGMGEGGMGWLSDEEKALLSAEMDKPGPLGDLMRKMMDHLDTGHDDMQAMDERSIDDAAQSAAIRNMRSMMTGPRKKGIEEE